MKKYLIYIESSQEFAWLDLDNNLTIANVDKFGKRDAIVRFGEFDNDICIAALHFAGKLIPIVKHRHNTRWLNSIIHRPCFLIGDFYLYPDKKAIKSEVYWY